MNRPFTGSTKNRFHSIAGVMICAIVFLGLSGCDRSTHITGIVKNAYGAVIPNVDIALTQGEHAVRTHSSNQGRFSIEMVHAPSNAKLTLSFTRDGYQPFSKSLNADDHLADLEITLQEAPEPTVAEVRKLRLKGLNAYEARERAELMCRQLPNAAAFPLKSFLSGDDVHDTLVLLSRFAQPCLVDHLTDSTWMPDSRSEPLAVFHSGDAALWILADAGLDWSSVIEPLMDPKKWRVIGVFAYFDWVNKGHHRKVVQGAVKRWLQQHPECCGSEADFGPTGINNTPTYKIAQQRFLELQQAWMKLKPGMNEKLARQLLGAPDAIADLEHLDGVVELNRFEKSAEFYVIENRTGKSAKFDYRNRDSLRDRYVIVFYGGNGKFVRAFSDVPELPPIYPQNEKHWSSMIEASQTRMQKQDR
ncbi:MAG TPA: carboxypeptidase-like regulatory domain-containing protein [Candidatus Angelobacter sp.]|nr:carboxypeptidase-like regulatory domain-containing protein [Candidatus Angelobacter sp.]